MDGINGRNIDRTLALLNFFFFALHIDFFLMKYKIFCDYKYNVHSVFMKNQEKLIFCKYTEFLCKMCVNNFYKCTKFFDL